MAVTTPDFRTHFPMFSDGAKFSDAEVQFWLTLAGKLHNADRWGDLLDEGLQLFVAHYLAVDAASRLAPGAGAGVPGQVTGAITSGSVDKVSYSRSPAAAGDPTAGHWALSTYGLRWLSLSKMVGAGPVQIGVPSPEDWRSGGAWPGVVQGYF